MFKPSVLEGAGASVMKSEPSFGDSMIDRLPSSPKRSLIQVFNG